MKYERFEDLPVWQALQDILDAAQKQRNQKDEEQ